MRYCSNDNFVYLKIYLKENKSINTILCFISKYIPYSSILSSLILNSVTPSERFSNNNLWYSGGNNYKGNNKIAITNISFRFLLKCVWQDLLQDWGVFENSANCAVQIFRLRDWWMQTCLQMFRLWSRLCAVSATIYLTCSGYIKWK